MPKQISILIILNAREFNCLLIDNVTDALLFHIIEIFKKVRMMKLVTNLAIRLQDENDRREQ